MNDPKLQPSPEYDNVTVEEFVDAIIEKFGAEVVRKFAAIQQIIHNNLFVFYTDVGDEAFDFYIRESLMRSLRLTLQNKEGVTVKAAREEAARHNKEEEAARIFHPDQAEGKPTSWE